MIRAILDAADDDNAPRLVYADWLIERGDRRGDFIVQQIQHVYDARIAAILKDEARAWIQPWMRCTGVDDWAFSRGLLQRLKVPIDVFLEVARQLLRASPLPYELVFVQWLELEAPWNEPERLPQYLAEVEELLRAVPLRLLSLTFRFPLDETCARVLESSPALRSLRHLGFEQVATGDAVIPRLLRNPHLDALIGLQMTSCAIDDERVQRIAVEPRVRQLRHLRIDNDRVTATTNLNTVGDAAAAALVTATPDLAMLMADGQRVGVELCRALASSAPHLVTLYLQRTRITSADARELAPLRELETVNLAHSSVDDDVLDVFLGMPRLEVLWLHDTRVTSRGASRLLREAGAALKNVTVPTRDMDPQLKRQLKDRFKLMIG